jgi:hypothetical protein
MFMRKIMVISMIFVVGLLLTGCESVRNLGEESLHLSQSTVKGSVRGWVVYTNPAYRYELRIPKDRAYGDSGEDGKELYVYDGAVDGSQLAMKITSTSNWKEGHSLEDFYQNQYVNYLENGSEYSDIEIGGKSGKWFHDIDVVGHTAQIIALDLSDRIIEIELYGMEQKDKVMLNSLSFYGE